MATLGTAATEIARKLLDEDGTAVSAATIKAAINEAITFWKQKRLWFNSTAADVTFNIGDTTLTTLPSDFLEPVPRNPLNVIQNGFPYRVVKRLPIVFDSHVSNVGTGRPLIFCYRNKQIEIYPYPDIVYSGKLYYVKDYTDFATNGGDDAKTNDWLTDGIRLVRSQALAWLHAEERQDEKMAEIYQGRANSEFNNLLSRTNKLLKSGTLTVEQMETTE